MICLGRASSGHPTLLEGPQFSLQKRRTVHSDFVWTFTISIVSPVATATLSPLVSNLIDQLGSTKIYTKFDLRVGYYNVHIAPDHEWKTTFCTRYGSFEFLVMPMGLMNAPATFQHFMNDIFQDMSDLFVIVYLDDILVFSKSVEEHHGHVRRVLS